MQNEDINNPSSFTWEIGVSKPEVGTNPSLNRGSAEGLDTANPRWMMTDYFSLWPKEKRVKRLFLKEWFHLA